MSSIADYMELAVVHRTQKAPWSSLSHPWMRWETCLRQILIGYSSWLPEVEVNHQDQVFTGTKAYEFLAEVACGLHSPMIGETEVFGQFKQLVESYNFSSLDLQQGKALHTLCQQLFSDVKTVRREHLLDLGSQSYGSYVRKTLKGANEIHILGAGHFVQEILPWLEKAPAALKVHCRDVDRAASQLKNICTHLEIFSLNQSEIFIRDSLIVAAPLPALRISEWLDSKLNCDLQTVVDVRSEASQDPLMTEASSQ